MPDLNRNLVWSPLFKALVAHREQCILLISPFIQSHILAKLLDEFSSTDGLQVITRWTHQDIVSGVSDIEVYKLLAERDVPLYINSHIHLKLYIFDGDHAFHTSGNITHKGLGLSQHSNVEIGCDVELTNDDWFRINDVLGQSQRVDESIYNQAKQYVELNKDKIPPLPKLEFTFADVDKEFSRLSLPFTQDPEVLWDFFCNDHVEGSRACYVHDLMLYGINGSNLDRQEFFDLLKSNFRAHPFIHAIANFIKQEGDVRFGGVNSWITSMCSDQPVPFRWELKPTTNRLYDWLEFFFDEISWDVPGAHSMVIRWDQENKNS